MAVTGSPRHPLLITLAALFLPGVGQVLNGQPQRGLMFAFFMVLGGWVTYHLTDPQEVSVIGRHAGGLFVYAVSILDAYKWARVRWEEARFRARNAPRS
ncbi:MAG: hypothetical protein NFCOHLIN_02610 [Gammaproteobacteria bacterium]|nr:hypothetical protein [Gammaproteobacteria bacterium]